jgi:hypothetical protein|tara:strand:- start:1633 stop:1983 length:351 start_codon:yes stop_codon:yes gene_type:complete
MTNPLRGEVNIELGSETYKARLNIDALVRIETELDQGILKLATRIAQADVRISELITVLKAALRGGGNDLQEKDVGKIITDIGIVQASTEVAKLLATTLSDPEEREEKVGKPEEQI